MIQKESSVIVCPRVLSIHSRQRQEKEQAKKSSSDETLLYLEDSLKMESMISIFSKDFGR